jgi:predicted NBD/HSP70 family sugar kinase
MGFSGSALPATAGGLLALIRAGAAVTRAELAALTGLARSTVSQRVEALLQAGLVVEVGDGPSTGGRRPTVLALDAKAGAILVGDLGATHARVAVTDLAATPLAETAADMDIGRGPDAVLGWLHETFDVLLAEADVPPSAVAGIGIGVPGPVAFATGTPVSPPIMPGWHGVRVPERFADRYAVPVVVDNDVNIMAAGEHWTRFRDVDDLLFVKVGTGIGCGIVAGGHVHRGAQGAAGDLGHVQLTDHPDALCRCGNLGCVEAIAGGAALARQLTELGRDAATSRDVVRLVRAGDADAQRLVREAGRTLGTVLAAAVNLLNPAVLVLGGDVALASEGLLAGVRETVYQRSLPLATRHLSIVRSELGDRAGIIGAASLAIERVLAPAQVDARLAAAAAPAARSAKVASNGAASAASGEPTDGTTNAPAPTTT